MNHKKCVLQNWVLDLGIKFQGTLLSSIRGCDTSFKNDISKDITKSLRDAILNSHCGDNKKSKKFIIHFSAYDFLTIVSVFYENYDHYPTHWIMHIIEASKIIGYFHPFPSTRYRWNLFYITMCKKLHVHPELKGELIFRLK